jgi:two-component system response regulator AtoC
LRTIETATQFPVQPSTYALTPGPQLVDNEPQPALQLAGVSAIWRKLLTQAEMAAPHIQVASIEGEAGSGKQTLARYLLNHSPLAQTDFLRRDAREWLTTEFDPAALGGFTYLDRVDLLAPPGQSLLLRVLKALQDRQDSPTRPAGRAILLASSQTPLRQMAGQGLLMPDLAYRLTAVRLAIPPLRQRREDIAPIAQCLLERLCGRYQQRPVVLGPGALARLLQHTWPGNIRELACVLETALLEAENGTIRALDLPIPPSFPLDQQRLSAPAYRPGASNPNFRPGTLDLAYRPGSPRTDPGPWGGDLASETWERTLRTTGGDPASEAWESEKSWEEKLRFGAALASTPTPNVGTWEDAQHAENLTLDAVIHHHVQSVLALNRGNKLRAARQLGISRSTLYRILGNQTILAH